MSYHDIIMSMKDRVRRPSTCRPHPKVKFTKEEDERLKQIVLNFGENDWSVIADHMNGRNQRQCRERWQNYLSPTVKRDSWTPEEDQLLIDKHNELGSRWVRIARFFTGRSDTAIKNRWMVLQRKILLEGEETIAPALCGISPTPFDDSQAEKQLQAQQQQQQQQVIKQFKQIKPIKTNKPIQMQSQSKKAIQHQHQQQSIKSIQAQDCELQQNRVVDIDRIKLNPEQQQQQQQQINSIEMLQQQIQQMQQLQNAISQKQQQLVQLQNLQIAPNHQYLALQQQQQQQQNLPFFQLQVQQIPQVLQKQKFELFPHDISPNSLTAVASTEPYAANSMKRDANTIDANDEVDFWDDIFSSNEFQSNADGFTW